MAESSGSGELGVGLQDIKNAKDRLHNPNGLSEQLEFNHKQLSLRVVASFFTLLIIGALLSWMVGMPPLIKWGFSLAALLSMITYLVLLLLKQIKLEKLREAQLRKHTESKAAK